MLNDWEARVWAAVAVVDHNANTERWVISGRPVPSEITHSLDQSSSCDNPSCHDLQPELNYSADAAPAKMPHGNLWGEIKSRATTGV